MSSYVPAQAQIAGAFLHPFVPFLHAESRHFVQRFAQALGCAPERVPAWPTRYMPRPELTCEQLAIAVRLSSVPAIAYEASHPTLRLMTRTAAPYGASPPDHPPALVDLYAARDSLGTRYHARVFADALLDHGHWLGEPLALWLSRPRGYPKKRWQMQAARALVDAVPDVYGLRHMRSA